GAIYRLDWPENRWQRVRLPGIELEVAQTFHDVVAKDHDTIFVVGEKGIIIRGQSTLSGGWDWIRLATPTQTSLISIAVSQSRLWVVGQGGVILTSGDNGDHWTQLAPVLNDEGRTIDLSRVRFFGARGWILGQGIVLRSESID